MPCIPKKTLELIVSLKCHFLVQVKGNCRKLWGNIALYTALATPITTCEYYENSHGNQIHRQVEVYTNNAILPKGWNGIKRLVKVRRWGFRNNKPFHEVTFFVLSKPINNAAVIAKAIQEHWSVENKLHWIKDVNMGEDFMTLRNKNAAANLAYLNNTAINILKCAGYKPTKDTFAKITNNVKELYKLFYSV